jgi:hypothetical protein
VTTSPVVALRKAIRAALLANSELTAKLGGAHVFDEAPRDAVAPYVTFGDVSVRDWSTASDTGAEQFVILHAWSMQRGVREALDVAAIVAAALDDASLSLDAHRLVAIRFISLEARRDYNGRFARASARFRAVTEQLV